MAWLKVDDGFADHPKVKSIPRSDRLAAIGLWTLAGAWCAKHLTDGFVPDYMLAELGGTKRLAAALAAVGLWDKVAQASQEPRASLAQASRDRCASGWQFHDWAEHQPSKEQVQHRRKATAERLRKWRERQASGSTEPPPADYDPAEQEDGNANGNGVTNGSGNGSGNASGNAAPGPTRPDPYLSSSVSEETYVSSEPENEPRSKPTTMDKARLARIYTDKVKLSNFGHVVTTVGIAMAAGYTAEQIAPAMARLARDGRNVTENTLRIEIENENKPAQSGSTTFYKTASGMSVEVY